MGLNYFPFFPWRASSTARLAYLSFQKKVTESKCFNLGSIVDLLMQKGLAENRILLSSLVFLVCFTIIDFLRANVFNSINQSIDLWAASINNGFFTMPAEIISIIFDTTSLVIMSLVIAVLFFVSHHRRYSLLLLSSMAGVALLVDVFKLLIQSSRPLNEILPETSYSFPSGHVTSTIVFFGILAYFAWKYWYTIKTKIMVSFAYISIIIIVGFDRIYLNVHWFSDVIGAIFLGSFWLAFCIYIFNRLISKNSRLPKLKLRQTKI